MFEFVSVVLSESVLASESGSKYVSGIGSSLVLSLSV